MADLTPDTYASAIQAVTGLRSGRGIAAALEGLQRSPASFPACTKLTGTADSYVMAFSQAAWTALWLSADAEILLFLDAARHVTPLPMGPLGNDDIQLARRLCQDPQVYGAWLNRLVDRIATSHDRTDADASGDSETDNVEGAVLDTDLYDSYLAQEIPEHATPAPRHQRQVTIVILTLIAEAMVTTSASQRRSLWSDWLDRWQEHDSALLSAVHRRMHAAAQDMYPLGQIERGSSPQRKGWVSTAGAAALAHMSVGGFRNIMDQFCTAFPAACKQTGRRWSFDAATVSRVFAPGSDWRPLSPNTYRKSRTPKISRPPQSGE